VSRWAQKLLPSTAEVQNAFSIPSLVFISRVRRVGFRQVAKIPTHPVICPFPQCCYIIGPIPWGHNGPLCHALSLSSSWTSMRRRRATVQWRHLVNWHETARYGEWAQHFSNASCVITVVSDIQTNVYGRTDGRHTRSKLDVALKSVDRNLRVNRQA